MSEAFRHHRNQTNLIIRVKDTLVFLAPLRTRIFARQQISDTRYLAREQ